MHHILSMKRILPKCVQCTVKGHEPDKLFGNEITMTTDKPKRRIYSEYTPSPNRNKTILSPQNLALNFILFFFVFCFERNEKIKDIFASQIIGKHLEKMRSDVIIKPKKKIYALQMANESIWNGFRTRFFFSFDISNYYSNGSRIQVTTRFIKIQNNSMNCLKAMTVHV